MIEIDLFYTYREGEKHIFKVKINTIENPKSP